MSKVPAASKKQSTILAGVVSVLLFFAAMSTPPFFTLFCVLFYYTKHTGFRNSNFMKALMKKMPNEREKVIKKPVIKAIIEKNTEHEKQNQVNVGNGAVHKKQTEKHAGGKSRMKKDFR